jgi:carboxylesterase type B
MAVQDLFKNSVGTGLLIGIAAVVLVPIALPVVARASKPFAKAVIKSGMIVYEKGREAFAELTEVVEDVVAEAKAEIEQEHAPKIATAAETQAKSAETPTKPVTGG